MFPETSYHIIIHVPLYKTIGLLDDILMNREFIISLIVLHPITYWSYLNTFNWPFYRVFSTLFVNKLPQLKRYVLCN